MRDNIQQKINKGNTTAKATDTQDRPMILRPVEPYEVVKFLERNKDKLEIITIGNKDK